jgi:hypothetical protein
MFFMSASYCFWMLLPTALSSTDLSKDCSFSIGSCRRSRSPRTQLTAPAKQKGEQANQDITSWIHLSGPWMRH